MLQIGFDLYIQVNQPWVVELVFLKLDYKNMILQHISEFKQAFFISVVGYYSWYIRALRRQ